jgi:GxxExxY protein
MEYSRKTDRKIFSPIPTEIEKIGKQVVDAAFKVHTALGPGLLESAYEACLVDELSTMGVKTQIQVPMPVIYDNQKINVGYRIDTFVEDCNTVELKAVENILPRYKAQLLTYMKLSDVRLGYLLNFNVPKLRDRINRMVL